MGVAVFAYALRGSAIALQVIPLSNKSRKFSDDQSARSVATWISCIYLKPMFDHVQSWFLNLYLTLPFPVFAVIATAIPFIALGIICFIPYFLIYLWCFVSQVFRLDSRKQSGNKQHYGGDVYRLEAELLKLLHGDSTTAKRLLKKVRVTHPGRDAKWYLEKVIWDLERDRY